MKEVIKRFFKLIFSDDNANPMSEVKVRPELVGSLFFAVASAILTVFNVYKEYWMMSNATMILTVGFIVSAVFVLLKKYGVSRVIIALLCAMIFSLFAITGGNEGFGILWIILVPTFSYVIIGMKLGFIVNLYFQIFLILLFYTPMRGIVMAHYDNIFMMRFPFLYFTSFVAITFLMCQRQSLYNRIHNQAYHDGLTGLCNRAYYKDFYKECKANGLLGDLTVFSFDLNELKKVNDTLSHDAGDELLIGAADVIRAAFPGDLCFRNGGDEFAVISSRPDAVESIEKLKEEIANWRGELVDTLNIAIGYAVAAEHPELDLTELSRLADRRMYEDKSEYYRAHGFKRRRSDRV